jgi:hypothetical protein
LPYCYALGLSKNHDFSSIYRKQDINQQTLISLGLMSSNTVKEVQVQYIDVKGKKGDVTVHTGMLKDSVRLLLGKPDEIELNRIGPIYFESWGYKLRNKYVSDLDIDFEDGKLKGVSQN